MSDAADRSSRVSRTRSPVSSANRQEDVRNIVLVEWCRLVPTESIALLVKVVGKLGMKLTSDESL